MAALLLSLALCASAVADGRAVLADLKDNEVVDGCYSDADFRDALRLARADQAQYGAAVDLIQEKQIACSGGQVTPKPVDSADDGDAGVGPVGIAVLAVIVAGLGGVAYAAWARRRGPSDDADA